MPQTISTVALVVRDYDEAIAFYIDALGFTLTAEWSPGALAVDTATVQVFGQSSVGGDSRAVVWRP